MYTSVTVLLGQNFTAFSFVCAGMLEVFGSWSKVTPHYEGSPFEGELERQLQDAMGEPETANGITIVTRDNSVKTGFSPPGAEP